jgi:hypothetical protein
LKKEDCSSREESDESEEEEESESEESEEEEEEEVQKKKKKKGLEEGLGLKEQRIWRSLMMMMRLHQKP